MPAGYSLSLGGQAEAQSESFAGLGAAILSRLETEAAEQKATALYLLTTSATAFFERHGYTTLPRSAAPPAIAASRQFSTLCPASASFMFKELRTQ